MDYALRRAEGFIMVTGRPGTGKTTLVEDLLSSLPRKHVVTSRLVSSQLQAEDLLRLVAFSFGLHAESQDKAGILHAVEHFLLGQAKQRKHVLLVIDEAQGLATEALEELRLLTNFHAQGRPLLQFFLVGQEPLRDMVRAPEMEQFHQRLIAACHLDPMGGDETRAYVEHRLQHAGWKGDPEIREDVFFLIHRFSLGIPRRINQLCSRLFLRGAVEGKHYLDGQDVLAVTEELREELLAPLDAPLAADLKELLKTFPVTPSAEADTGTTWDDAHEPHQPGQPVDRPPVDPDVSSEPDDARRWGGPVLNEGEPAPPASSVESDAVPETAQAAEPSERGVEKAGAGAAEAPLTGEALQRASSVAEPREDGPHLKRRFALLVLTIGLALAGAYALRPEGFTDLQRDLRSWLVVGLDAFHDWTRGPVEEGTSGDLTRGEQTVGPLGREFESPGAMEGSSSPGRETGPRVARAVVSVPELPDILVEDRGATGQILVPTPRPVPATAGPQPVESEAEPDTGGQTARGSAPAGEDLPVPGPRERIQGSDLASSTVSQGQGERPGLSEQSLKGAEAQVLSLAETPPPASPSPGQQVARSQVHDVSVESMQDTGTALKDMLDSLERDLRGAGLPVQGHDGKTLRLSLRREVPFRFDSAEIPLRSFAVLDALVTILRDHGHTSVTVVGHTDSTGSDDYNLVLSLRRATAVADYLVEGGVAASHVQSEGRGESEPLSNSRTGVGHGMWRDRRIEIIMVPKSMPPRGGILR